MRRQARPCAVGPDDRIALEHAVAAVDAAHRIALAGAGLRHRRLRAAQYNGGEAERKHPLDGHAASEKSVAVSVSRRRRRFSVQRLSPAARLPSEGIPNYL